nr:MAG TPA: hypothetical protein [Caudoviricetes sp.]
MRYFIALAPYLMVAVFVKRNPAPGLVTTA